MLSGVSCPMIAYHIMEVPSVIFLLFIYIFGQPYALCQNEHQHQCGEAEQFEIHPAIGGVVECHIQVDETEHCEEQAPAQVEAMPDMQRQRDLFLQQQLHQVLVEHHVRKQQDGREHPVQHGRLPLDEGLVMQQQGRTAEHGDDGETHPQHHIHFAMPEFRPDDLDYRGGDRYRRGDVDALELECDEETDDGEEDEQQFHIGVLCCVG